MRLPYMKLSMKKKKKQIITFGGLNYGHGASDGELEESLNLTTARFPCLSQRAGRKSTGVAYQNPNGLFIDANGKHLVVDGISVLYDGKIVGTVSTGVTARKHIMSIGSKIVIFPDAVYYDRHVGANGNLTTEFRDLGKLRFPKFAVKFEGKNIIGNVGITDGKHWGETYVVKAGTGTIVELGSQNITVYRDISLDRKAGALLKVLKTQTTFAGLQSGMYTDYQCEEGNYGAGDQYKIIDSVTPVEDGKYKVAYSLYQVFYSSYPTFDHFFKAGDYVHVACTGEFAENSGGYVIDSVSGWTITTKGPSFKNEGLANSEMTLGWDFPNFTCVCECDNRLWGADGNTIYASALGDPTHFFEYNGVSTDSYAVAVGTDGDFTACCGYSGAVLFWKENCLHKVFGSYPAQYEVYTYYIPGVQKDSEKSLVNLNEVLYYQGKNGIYAYTGGTPELLTEKFGLRRFNYGVAGTDGERYYISMSKEGGGCELYVFDPRRGLWLREDDTFVWDFAQANGSLYFLDGKSDKVFEMGQDYSEEGAIPWSATLCQMDETSHGQKGYSKLYLRADMEAGAWIKVEVSTDGGPFQKVFRTHNHRARTIVVPILPKRCDNFQVRLSGEGLCIIKSLVREYSLGSEY